MLEKITCVCTNLYEKMDNFNETLKVSSKLYNRRSNFKIEAFEKFKKLVEEFEQNLY